MGTKQGIARDYVAGVTITEIARKWGVHIRYVHTVRKELDLPLRRGKGGACDNNFFSNVDTEEKAYWLGFFAADGNVYKDSLSLKLKASDAAHVDSFRCALKGLAKLEVTDKYARWRVYSRQLSKDLLSYGVGPAKSNTLVPFEDLPRDLNRHYWRGFVDGDGWVSYFPDKSPGARTVVGLCGTFATVSGFLTFLRSQGVSSKRVPVKSSNGTFTYQTSITGKGSVYPTLQVLYGNSTHFLPRKKEKAAAAYLNFTGQELV